MKHILHILGLLLLASGCFNNDNNYDYRDINSFDDYTVENLRTLYTCFQGDILEFDPNPKMTLDSIQKQDLSYEWYVGYEIKSKERRFEYEATEIGQFVLTFVTIDNRTGLRFPYEITIKVEGRGYKGWWILSKKNGNESMLSSVWSRVYSFYRTDAQGNIVFDWYGNPILVDTILYEGESIDFIPGLGRGPIKLVENFVSKDNSFEGEEFSDDEIMVLQKERCVELDGINYKPIAYAENEFMDGMPADFEPVEAVLSYSSKCLLNKNGLCWFNINSVATNLHSGRYSTDPAFNGKKIGGIWSTNKAGARDKRNYFMMLDKTSNSLLGVADNGRTNMENPVIDIQKNFTGQVLTIANNNKPATMALFNNIKYEIIWNMWTGDGIWQKKSTTGQSWICILHDKNTDEYFHHGYQLYYGEDKKNPTLRIMRDFVKPINKEMFAGGNYTIVRFQHQNYLLVANHDKVWLCNYNKENPDQGEYFANFQGENIVAMAAKDVNSTKFGGPHVGIAFENGTFRIFEVLFNESLNTRSFNLLYQKQGFGEIVDVIFKHGSVNNLNTSSLF